MKNMKIKKTILLLLCLCFLVMTFCATEILANAASKSNTVKVSKPKISSVTLVGANSLNIKWAKVSASNGYVVYRKTGNGTYKKVATLNGNKKTSYTNKGLSYGKKYYYKVRAYKKVKGKMYYGGYSAAKSNTTVGTPQISSATLVGANSLNIKWTKVSASNGYVVYRKTGDGTYKKVATLNGNKKTSYTNKGLSYGKKYYYKIRAYIKVKGKIYYGEYSAAKYDTTIGTPEISSVVPLDIDTMKIKWTKQKSATGYVLYYKTLEGNYKKLATLGKNTTSYTHKKLTANKKYFYRIRSYKKVNEKTYYGKYSNVKGQTLTNYLMNMIKPYYIHDYNVYYDYEEFASPNTFKMGGENYTNGFLLSYDCSATFNLKSKYKKISFVVGNVDGYTGTGKLHIMSDNTCVKTCEVMGNDLPKTYTVYIENAAKLEFIHETDIYSDWGDIGIGNIKIYK